MKILIFFLKLSFHDVSDLLHLLRVYLNHEEERLLLELL